MPDKKNPDSPTPLPEGRAEIARAWLTARLCEIEEHTKKDVLTIMGGLDETIATRVRLALEHIAAERKKILMVILDTPGGSIEAAKLIVQTLRNFYNTVHFLVPRAAMSAGTVMVMSGNEIYMDYFSRLGPIDPQILRGNSYVPALSYLRQYDKIKKKAEKGQLTSVDAFMLEKLDLAELDTIELQKALSESLITDWLPRYKFQDWDATSGEKQARAKEIAEKLNDQEKWFVHGHGIHKDVLWTDLRLKTKDYSDDEKLKSLVWKYFWALQETYMSCVHSRKYI